VKHGYVQVYTGNGKGKTTAALGLALRAVGAGLKVYIGQFIKKGCFSEICALSQRFPDIVVRQYGHGGFIRGNPQPDDIRCARRGLAALRRAVTGKRYDLVIADEANCAVACGVLAIDDLLELIDSKPVGVELVLTGYHAHPRLIRRADLVTEMRAVKHYYQNKVPARKGIEH
jgi:cob(I)alamin adenosyltransferase